ncbi:MAG: hypothetical protein HYV63_03270 [Candidatus Schekmanbacteria bacterium]|nr:hypothetical protein [Candidatus Schekmanbacteria bacterium]
MLDRLEGGSDVEVFSGPDGWMETVGIETFNDLRTHGVELTPELRKRFSSILGDWMVQPDTELAVAFRPVSPGEYGVGLTANQSLAVVHPHSTSAYVKPKADRPQATFLARLFHGLPAMALAPGGQTLSPEVHAAATVLWYLYRMEATLIELFDWETSVVNVRRFGDPARAHAAQPAVTGAPGGAAQPAEPRPAPVSPPGKLPQALLDRQRTIRGQFVACLFMDDPRLLQYLTSLETHGGLAPLLHGLLQRPMGVPEVTTEVEGRQAVAARLRWIGGQIPPQDVAAGFNVKYGWQSGAPAEALVKSLGLTGPGSGSPTHPADPKRPSPVLAAVAQPAVTPQVLGTVIGALLQGRRAVQSLMGYGDAELMKFARRAWHLCKEKGPGLALAISEAMLLLRPDEPYFWHLQGAISALDGDHDRALGQFREACERNPRDVCSASAIHEILLRRGEHERAADVLERLVAPSAGEGAVATGPAQCLALNRQRLLVTYLIKQPWN